MNKIVNLKRPLQVNKRDISNSNESSTGEFWIDEICNEGRSVEEQVPLIVKEIEAESNYYRNIIKIIDNLSNLVNLFYGKRVVGIKLFGSGMTKLALKNSDVDIFIDFGGRLPEEPGIFARSLRNKIKKTACSFKKPIAIPARVPIVQCIHYSGINCDISFLNGLGVSNSNLIRFLLTLDERIRPLLLILKYLNKKEKIIGSSSLTSYALTVLVIYFLQQLEKPILPPISYLQEKAPKKETIAGWTTSFVSDKNLLPPINNNSSITDLFKQFFEFVATFEFGFYVISSFTAKTYLKPHFADPELIADEFPNYIKNINENESLKFECDKPMCVQGPFNLSHNIARNVRVHTLQKFQSFCSDCLIVCQNSTRDNEKKGEFFKNLLKLNNEDLKIKKLKKDSFVRIYVGRNINMTDSNCTEESLRSEWSKFALSQVIDVLTKIMRCKVTACSIDKNQHEKMDFTNGEIIKLLKCEFYHMELITKKRNAVKPEFEFTKNMHIIEQEEIISDYLCDTILQNSEKISVQFEITCSVEKRPTCLCLKLDSDSKTKLDRNNVYQIFNFIQTLFPKWIQ